MSRSEKSLANKRKYDSDYVRTHYKRISLNVPFSDYDEIKAAADSVGVPVNTFIKTAIHEYISTSKASPKNQECP